SRRRRDRGQRRRRALAGRRLRRERPPAATRRDPGRARARLRRLGHGLVTVALLLPATSDAWAEIEVTPPAVTGSVKTPGGSDGTIVWPFTTAVTVAASPSWKRRTAGSRRVSDGAVVSTVIGAESVVVPVVFPTSVTASYVPSGTRAPKFIPFQPTA